MASEENSNLNQDISEFLKSLKDDKTAKGSEIGGDGFPFSDDFDMDAFVKANNDPLERTLTSIKLPQVKTTQKQDYNFEPKTQNQTPAQPDLTNQASPSAQAEPIKNDKEPSAPKAEPATKPALENLEDFNLDFQDDLKEQSIKHLEAKIAELETRFVDANKEKSLNAALSAELDGDKDEGQYTPQVKSNDEFFHNISSTIETLKGSLENIVSARLLYEENILRQDQTLITRLREKTSRLKAINLALNSEVKRAKNEKLESLRRSAEQTKELLSIRMQLSKVEEKARHGDFKLSRLEQQLSIVNEEKATLDSEIQKIREEKLNSLKETSQQAKEIMALRLEFSKTEERFRQEELKSASLREQLQILEKQRAERDNAIYATRSEREEANRRAAAQEREISNLKQDLASSQEQLKAEASQAGKLRETLLNLETQLQRISSEKADALFKADEALNALQIARLTHEREISNLKAAQIQEIELLKSQKEQESNAIAQELKRVEGKYRQEENFVKTLKLQIESLDNDLKNIEVSLAAVKGKSSALTGEEAFIKENHTRQIANLNAELASSQTKFQRLEENYKTLSDQLQNVEAEKATLNEEIKRLLSQNKDSLKQNEAYLTQIETLRSEHSSVLNKLKTALADAAQITTSLTSLKFALNEKDSIVASLKSEVASLERGKALIDEEAKKAAIERLSLLKQLEDTTKEFTAFQQKHEQEIQTLRDENAAQAQVFETKLSEAAQRLQSEEKTVAELKGQIKTLEEEKNSLGQNSAATSQANAANVKKMVEQAEEILALKSQLAKAENRFLQDTVLLDQLKDQFKQKQTQTSQLDDQMQKLRLENEKIAKDLQEKEQEIAALHQDLANAGKQIKEDEIAIKQLQEHTSKLKAVNFALDKEIKKVQAEKMEALQKSADQAKEILMLRSQLSRAESGMHTLDFQNGIISIRKEYEAKIEKIEGELKDVSAKFAEQVKEIQSLRTDNTRLKDAESERIRIENEFNLLSQKAASLEAQLGDYVKKDKDQSTLIKAKAAALSAQIAKINNEKAALQTQLEERQAQIQTLTASEKKMASTLISLKEKIDGNDAVIEKLKLDIVRLTSENENLRASAEHSLRRERTLTNKIEEVETENKKLTSTFRSPLVQVIQNHTEQSDTAAIEPSKADTTEEAAQNTAQQGAAKQDTVQPIQAAKNTREIKANITQTFTSPAKIFTSDARPITPKEQNAPEEEKDDAFSLLDFPEVKEAEDSEVIDVKSSGMDLSMIFGDDLPKEDAPVPATNANASASPSAKARDGLNSMPPTLPPVPFKQPFSPVPDYDDDTQDHAAKPQGTARKSALRVPQTYDGTEPYSDFLKRTKSMFFRIKWSLFKD
ncbi:MAG: hypothetical protein LBM71_01000 [Elusimicrobiota bacterium]|jgi:chromosome segregation ATPase|nr:hypothetical protein [Elusimicrobiota bacterium]